MWLKSIFMDNNDAPIQLIWSMALFFLTHWPMWDAAMIKKNLIFKLITQNNSLGTNREIDLMWMPQNLVNDKSKLVQVLAWCRQATSNYMCQC